jgi:hypothetical protein
MKKFVLAALSTLALLAVSAFAADIDGKWVSDAPAGGKGGPQTLSLKAEGSKLTGTISGGAGGAETAITDGTITGPDVAFKVIRDFGGNKVEVTWKGTLAGTELKLQRTAAAGGKGGPQDVTFKKQ